MEIILNRFRGLPIVLLIFCSLGCSRLGLFTGDDDKVSALTEQDTLNLEPREGTFYFRVPGVGTVLQEFYGYSADERLFKNWSLELTDYAVTCPTSPCDQIIPLQVNNKWMYEITVFDSLGTPMDTVIDTSYVARDTVINSETWYILYAFKSPTAVSINRADGYYTMAVDSVVAGNIFGLSDEYLAAKFPTSVGDRFDNQPGFESITLKADSTITVQAGSFNSYLYVRTFK